MILSKPFALFFSVAVLLAILLPVKENWNEKPRDSFPLSYFPMFSSKRDSICTVNYFVGYDTLGNRYYIPHGMVGSGGFNQVRRQVNKKVRTEKAEKITQRVAKKVAKCQETPYCHLVRIALVRGDFDLNDYFQKGIKMPQQEKVIFTKTIERS
jgi:hypothetical protein